MKRKRVKTRHVIVTAFCEVYLRPETKALMTMAPRNRRRMVESALTGAAALLAEAAWIAGHNEAMEL